VVSFSKIESAKHIVIECTNDTVCNGSALYTYILTLHKKVSFVQLEAIDRKFSFLPWYDKLRKNVPSSADYTVRLTKDSLYKSFCIHNIKINKKMATSLYAGYLREFRKLVYSNLDGTFFACMSELIALGAEYKSCRESLLLSDSLSSFRLKAFMFHSMQLIENATTALFVLRESDLQASGATLDDAIEISKEALMIVHVQKVCLHDEQNKLIYMQEEI
jgi:phosphoesterase RecJ-like protein